MRGMYREDWSAPHLWLLIHTCSSSVLPRLRWTIGKNLPEKFLTYNWLTQGSRFLSRSLNTLWRRLRWHLFLNWSYLTNLHHLVSRASIFNIVSILFINRVGTYAAHAIHLLLEEPELSQIQLLWVVHILGLVKLQRARVLHKAPHST